jgi:hypothetical protein
MARPIKPHRQNDPYAIGEHVPWRENPAEQQRARQRQPKGVERGHMEQPKQFHGDGDRG